MVDNDNGVGGCRIAGYKNSLTTICSKVLQRTDVIEIGLKSARLSGEGILSTCRIEAFFHWRGTIDVANVESEEEEVVGKGIVESEIEELVPE